MDPFTALFNLKTDGLTYFQIKLLIPLLTAAKQTMVAKAWKTSVLGIAETKHRMNITMSHAKMIAIDGNQILKFKKRWHPWIKHYLPLDFNDTVPLPW